MASSQTAQCSQSVPGSSSSIVDKYEEPSRTLLTPIDSLEFLCELIVDFVSMKENGYDLTPDVEFQGWTKILIIYWVQFFQCWLNNSGFMLLLQIIRSPLL